MFIKVTNANGRQDGETLLIDIDHVVSISRGEAAREDGTTARVTYLFLPPHGTWEVSETPDEIYEMIQKG